MASAARCPFAGDRGLVARLEDPVPDDGSALDHEVADPSGPAQHERGHRVSVGPRRREAVGREQGEIGALADLDRPDVVTPEARRSATRGDAEGLPGRDRRGAMDPARDEQRLPDLRGEVCRHRSTPTRPRRDRPSRPRPAPRAPGRRRRRAGGSSWGTRRPPHPTRRSVGRPDRRGARSGRARRPRRANPTRPSAPPDAGRTARGSRPPPRASRRDGCGAARRAGARAPPTRASAARRPRTENRGRPRSGASRRATGRGSRRTASSVAARISSVSWHTSSGGSPPSATPRSIEPRVGWNRIPSSPAAAIVASSTPSRPRGNR